jgi:YD repeat-containing protein
VSSYVYTFDNNGNRLTRVEANGSAAQATSYDYDHNDRLTVVTYPDKTTTYTYDPAYDRHTEVLSRIRTVKLSRSTKYASRSLSP